MARRVPSRRRRRNGSLDWAVCLPLDCHMKQLDADLLGEGWERARAVRAIENLTGRYTLCFVWHRYNDGVKRKYSVVYRGLDLRPEAAP